jgi:hypothetical protein
LIAPSRAIGPFTARLTIEENATDELEISQHPVQQGANTTDNAFLKPATLDVKVIFDDSSEPLSEVYAKLRKLQASREPFQVVTGKRIYKNMLIKSLSQSTDKDTENVLSISMNLQEIILVAIEIVSVPARARQRNPGQTGKTENAGQKKTQPINEKEKGTEKYQSILKAARG